MTPEEIDQRVSLLVLLIIFIITGCLTIVYLQRRAESTTAKVGMAYVTIEPSAPLVTPSKMLEAYEIPSGQYVSVPIADTETFTLLDAGYGVVIDSRERYTMSLATVKKLIRSQTNSISIIKIQSALKNVNWRDMVTDSIIESGLGSSNGCNRYGYCGMFQFGRAAWKDHGKGSRTNKIANTKAALSLRSYNHEKLVLAGIQPTGFHLYAAHQQGHAGLTRQIGLINGESLLSSRKRTRLSMAICNNIPMKMRRKVCRYKKLKTRRAWIKRSEVDLSDLASIHYSVWEHEYNKIKEVVDEI